jgi:hypothetical protein
MFIRFLLQKYNLVYPFAMAEKLTYQKNQMFSSVYQWILNLEILCILNDKLTSI